MRFAFKTSPQNTTWASMLAVWQAADDIDVFESGWTFDHFYPIFSDSSGPSLEGWTTRPARAQATTRLRLGTLVTGVHYRHPAVLANMAAALAIISNRRTARAKGAAAREGRAGAGEPRAWRQSPPSKGPPEASPGPRGARPRRSASAAAERSARCASPR